MFTKTFKYTYIYLLCMAANKIYKCGDSPVVTLNQKILDSMDVKVGMKVKIEIVDRDQLRLRIIR